MRQRSFCFLGAYLYFTRSAKDKTPAVTNAVTEDVAPGSNRAILKLADGKIIVLDSAGNGMIAKEGDVEIIKKEGQIVYGSEGGVISSRDNRSLGEGRTGYNTMSTPRGGQYQLTLPDGTKTWLNAESSITYPTVFTGKERKVSITGEVYFEVARNRSQPFKVNVTPSPAVSPAEAQRRWGGGEGVDPKLHQIHQSKSKSWALNLM